MSNGCGKFEDLLARHLHGGVLAREREELDRHLDACPGCANLYRELSGIDGALRGYPAKTVDPPAHLHSRIVANLPEELTPLWGGWGGWAFGFASLAVGFIALFLVYRMTGTTVERIASAPAPSAVPPPPSSSGSARTPVLSAPPGGKRNRGPVTAAAPKAEVIKEVKIFFYYPPARTVAVTGDFNDWNPDGVPLKAAGKPGLWEADLRLPPGVYSYNFIVDGELLVPDPNSANQMPDGYGGTDSLLLVKEGGSI